MKKKRFSEAQIVKVLKEAEAGVPAARRIYPRASLQWSIIKT